MICEVETGFCYKICEERNTNNLPMVLIIDGEIVQDNDPRAIARRQPKAAPRSSNSSGMGRVPPGGGPQGPRGGPPGGAGGPLDALATTLGIQGQSVEIPAFSRLPARQVPLIALLLLAVATLFFGWQILALAAVLHVFSGLSEQAAAPAGAGQRANAGAPSGG